MNDTDRLEHEDLMGPIAAREFANAKDVHKERTLKWIQRAHEMGDEDFFWECAIAIHGSALMQSFKGNWEHEHCKASFAYHESRRRHTAAGHDKNCRGTSIYSRAYDQVVREQGHPQLVRGPVPCNCAELRAEEETS